MKRYILQLFLILITGFCSVAYAQAPQQFSYQGVLRKADGTPYANQTITLRLSILDGSSSGTSVYSETRQVTTTQLGLYVVAIGSSGTMSSTNNFSSVAWGSGLKYLKVEVDMAGGTNFVTAGASQLLSVPYALYAASSGTAGPAGKSAYQSWLDAGNTGSEAAFLNSLKASSEPASGDISGTYPALTVVKIQGVNISSTPPAVGQFLRYDGTKWAPATIQAADVTGLDVKTNNSNVIKLTNAAGAALKPLEIDLTPGANGTVLTTNTSGAVGWQTPTQAQLVSGKMYNLSGVTTNIPENNVKEYFATIAGLQVGTSIFIIPEGDNTEFSILSATVSATDTLKIIFANYQPVDVPLSGVNFKVLVINN